MTGIPCIIICADPHLLLGPSGIWVLLPRHQTGKIIYQKGRFKQKGGGILQGYLRMFAQEGMGRPDLELEGEIDAVKRFIKKKLPEHGNARCSGRNGIHQ